MRRTRQGFAGPESAQKRGSQELACPGLRGEISARDWAQLRTALRSQPKLGSGCIDRETDPERDAEELTRAKMRAGTSCEEDSHDGASRCDTEQDAHGAGHPLPLSHWFAVEAKPIGTPQREQKPGVEDKDGGALKPAADGIGTHRIGGRGQ